MIIYHFGHRMQVHIGCFDSVEIGRICQFAVAHLDMHFVINACTDDIIEQGGSTLYQHRMDITRCQAAEDILPIGAVAIDDSLGIG